MHCFLKYRVSLNYIYIALRSWMLVPYAYYIKGERNAKGLTAEEFAFLTECDGRSELPDEAESPLARKFLADGFIRHVRRGAEHEWVFYRPAGA